MRPPNLVEGLSWILVIAILAFIGLWLLTACSSHKIQELHILCTGPDGQVFHASGRVAQQAKSMSDEFDLSACGVNVKREEGSGK